MTREEIIANQIKGYGMKVIPTDRFDNDTMIDVSGDFATLVDGKVVIPYHLNIDRSSTQELLTNNGVWSGAFTNASDLDNWYSTNGATLTIVDNKLLIEDNSPYHSKANIDIDTISGQEYILAYEFYAGTWNQHQVFADDVSISTEYTIDGPKEIIFTASDESTTLSFESSSGVSRGNFSITNISIKLKNLIYK